MAQPQAPHHRQRFLPQGKWGRATTQNLQDHLSHAPASILHTLSDHEESLNPKKEIWLPPRCALWDDFLAVRSRGWPSGCGPQGASLMCWMQHPSFWQCLNPVSCKLVLKELWIKRTDLMGLSPSQDLFKLINYSNWTWEIVGNGGGGSTKPHKTWRHGNTQCLPDSRLPSSKSGAPSCAPRSRGWRSTVECAALRLSTWGPLGVVDTVRLKVLKRSPS